MLRFVKLSSGYLAQVRSPALADHQLPGQHTARWLLLDGERDLKGAALIRILSIHEYDQNGSKKAAISLFLHQNPLTGLSLI